MNCANNIRIPAISVLMSVYKEPLEWLKCSLGSILNQSFSDFEFIIVVDNPENQDVINYLKQKKEEDDRIILLINEENIGLTKSLNKGLRIAKGKYVARMDADDRSYPERFAKQYTFMESHPKVILCGTSIKYIGGKGNRCQLYPSNDYDIKAEMLFNSGFSHPTIMIKRQTLVENGISYDEEYRQTQDFRLYETLYDMGDFANLSEVLLDYRISEKQISTRLHGRQGNLMQMIRRRMINKWLVKIGYHELDDFRNIDRLKIRKDIINILKNKDVYFNTFMKTMYYTNTTNKMGLFLCSLLNGDFFRMNKKDKISYVGIVIGRVMPIPL
ncbi:MAG: glycosyltransferase [Prevotella sp.]|nr:glycosyltransferase [Prevotella sp.]